MKSVGGTMRKQAPLRNLLLVDDEQQILNSLKRELRDECYRIHTAEGGRAGLEILKKHDIGVVLSDQMMPEMDGIAFLEEVKRLKLQATGLPVETGSGGRTKFNRTTRACPRRTGWTRRASGPAPPSTSASKASGPCWSRRAGMVSGTEWDGQVRVPERQPARRPKTSVRLPTGDIVRADIPNGKHQGRHTGRIAIRHRPVVPHRDRSTVHSEHSPLSTVPTGTTYTLGETIE